MENVMTKTLNIQLTNDDKRAILTLLVISGMAMLPVAVSASYSTDMDLIEWLHSHNYINKYDSAPLSVLVSLYGVVTGYYLYTQDYTWYKVQTDFALIAGGSATLAAILALIGVELPAGILAVFVGTTGAIAA